MIRVHSRKDFPTNTMEVWILQTFSPATSPSQLGVIVENRLTFVDYDPAIAHEPTYRFPLDDVWDAVVSHIVLEYASQLPASKFLADRLEIETARVDKLLEAFLP